MGGQALPALLTLEGRCSRPSASRSGSGPPTAEVKPAILVVATGGEKRGGKRGRGSKNKTPLATAVQVTNDTQQPVVLRLILVAGFRKAKLERWAREHLEPGTTVHSDGLACFSGVEAAGCRHEATVTGGGPGSCETAGLVWVNTTLGNVQRSMDGSYHAVGPKCLARYLAEFRFNRRYDLEALAERLLRAAAATLPLPHPLLAAQPFCCQ